MAEKRAQTTVRLDKATVQRLRDRVGRLVMAVQEGFMDEPEGWCLEQINPLALPWSMDQMINFLLDRDDAHRRRRAESKRARPAAEPEPDAIDMERLAEEVARLDQQEQRSQD